MRCNAFTPSQLLSDIQGFLFLDVGPGELACLILNKGGGEMVLSVVITDDTGVDIAMGPGTGLAARLKIGRS